MMDIPIVANGHLTFLFRISGKSRAIKMILARRPAIGVSSIYGEYFSKPFSTLLLFPNCALSTSIVNSSCSSRASLKCCCIKNEITEKPIEDKQGFSVFTPDIPWESEGTWSTLAFYMFNLHIPLGYGGLSIIAYILRQPALDPQTQALSLLVIQILELSGVLFLLSRTIKPEHDLINFFRANKLAGERNWLLSSALGFGFLVSLVFLTSVVAEQLSGAKATSNPIVKGILLSGDISKAACFLVYCVFAPILEESVYRGILLRSLASATKWENAVLISSAIFSAAHFSSDNFVQLFIVGCVLGCSYCWSGNLSSPILIHSLYNAFTLMVTFLS